MKIVRVNDDNLHLLEHFVKNLGTSAHHFRYFNSRPLSATKNHLATLLLSDGRQAVAYGHLDLENDTVWLGIAVAPNEVGKGYGGEMMNALLDTARDLALTRIYLTVDKDNLNAIHLYEKKRFVQTHEFEHSFKYLLELA